MKGTTATVATDTELRESARVSLRANLLDHKVKGDRITAAEIVEATGFGDWRSFGGTIRSWARRRGLALFPVVNDGWRIGLDHEHVDYAARRRVSALKSEKRGVRVLGATDTTKLDDRQLRRYQHDLPRATARLAMADEHERESRELVAPKERVPLRIAAKGM